LFSALSSGTAATKMKKQKEASYVLEFSGDFDSKIQVQYLAQEKLFQFEKTHLYTVEGIQLFLMLYMEYGERKKTNRKKK
jgi:hypothetical protein